MVDVNVGKLTVRFRDLYYGGLIKGQAERVRAVAMNPGTYNQLLAASATDDCVGNTVFGFEVCLSQNVPDDEVRIVPSGTLEYVIRDGWTWAWPNLQPLKRRGLLRTRNLDKDYVEVRGVGVSGRITHRVKEMLRETEHPVYGPPNARVTKGCGQEGAYFVQLRYPYKNPSGNSARAVVQVTEEILEHDPHFLKGQAESIKLKPYPVEGKDGYATLPFTHNHQ